MSDEAADTADASTAPLPDTARRPNTAPLPDGRYDVIVVDATTAESTTAGGGSVTTVDVAVLAGPHKGEVLTLGASGLEGDEIDLLGMPGTLTVDGSVPTLVVES